MFLSIERRFLYLWTILRISIRYIFVAQSVQAFSLSLIPTNGNSAYSYEDRQERRCMAKRRNICIHCAYFTCSPILSQDPVRGKILLRLFVCTCFVVYGVCVCQLCGDCIVLCLLACTVLFVVPLLAFCSSARITVCDLLYEVVAPVHFRAPTCKAESCISVDSGLVVAFEYVVGFRRFF